MFARRSVLAFETDDAGRFLPWLVAFMVYLAVLAAAGTVVLAKLAHHWDQGVAATMTVQIPPAGDPKADDDRISKSLAALRATAGVIRADAVTADEVKALLEPWLGDAVQSDELPLPRLIGVEIDRTSGLTAAALVDALHPIAPDAAVDDHRVWLDGLIQAVRSAEFVATVVLILISLITIATVIFTTRAGLGLHREAIEVLHLIGAQDSYIARQFATRALWLGIKGGTIGLLAAAPTLWLFRFLGARLQSGLLPDLALSPQQWGGLLLLMPAVVVIAVITARVTVLRTLARMV
jgi:cell division transport system permease protein